MARTLFTNVEVLDCSGDEPFAGEVLVEGARIAAVHRDGPPLPRDGADVVDVATLMPGLIESHSHLSIDNSDDLAKIGAVPPEETVLIAVRNARLYLDCGSRVASAPLPPSPGRRRHPESEQRGPDPRAEAPRRNPLVDGYRGSRRPQDAPYASRGVDGDHRRRPGRGASRHAGNDPRGRRHHQARDLGRHVRTPCAVELDGDERSRGRGRGRPQAR